MRVIPQEGAPSASLGQVPRSPPLKHTTVSDSFSTKSAISAHILLSLPEIAISACRDVISGRDNYLFEKIMTMPKRILKKS